MVNACRGTFFISYTSFPAVDSGDVLDMRETTYEGVDISFGFLKKNWRCFAVVWWYFVVPVGRRGTEEHNWRMWVWLGLQREISFVVVGPNFCFFFLSFFNLLVTNKSKIYQKRNKKHKIVILCSS